jgi:hypothetical protein
MRPPTVVLMLALTLPAPAAAQDSLRTIPRELGGYALGAGAASLPRGISCAADRGGRTCEVRRNLRVTLTDSVVSGVTQLEWITTTDLTPAEAMAQAVMPGAAGNYGPPDSTAVTENAARGLWNVGGRRLLRVTVQPQDARGFSRTTTRWRVATQVMCDTARPDWSTSCPEGNGR